MKTMRLWFACVFGLALSMVFGWSYGFFAILLPTFIIARADHFNVSLINQMVLGIVWVSLEVNFISGFLQPYPWLMTVAVAILFMSKCIAMTKPSGYLFGFTGLLVGSIALNFMSYPGFDSEEFTLTLWVSALAIYPICGLAYYLFSEPEREAKLEQSQQTNVAVQHDHIGVLRQTAMGWTISMLAFLIFQFGDLSDSVSAQASIFIVLTPMTFIGSMAAAKIRISGTLLGCVAGMAIQLGLSSWANNGLLFLMAFAIAVGFFAWLLALGGVKGGLGFSAMSALSVPLTTAFQPGQQDAFFAIIYRFSSITFTVVLTSLAIWFVHCVLVRVIKA
ncbi:MFS transporter [Moritella sp. Urea-trap-13]|nr:MFS transporter [Moritella sp. Urea-trap-13]